MCTGSLDEHGCFVCFVLLRGLPNGDDGDCDICFLFVDVLVAAKEEAAKMLKGAREMAKRRAMDEEEKALLGDIQRVRRMCALGAS